MDEDLEDEVAEECEKHGAVHRVMIFEVTESGYDPREAVRIFVEFTKPEDAAKCANEMGRSVLRRADRRGVALRRRSV